ncbi:ferritin-like domain-containing protein [Obelidium mucronatum]|nr:ferritin-like domain-containing protein [Obelidium mucronatum]
MKVFTTVLALLAVASTVFANEEGGAKPEGEGAKAEGGAKGEGAPRGEAKAEGGAGGAQIDLTVLNFALTLEHLESTFYQEGLARFGVADFENIGIPASVANEFLTVAAEEAIHVTTLQSVIGAKFGMNLAVPKCVYNFDAALANVQSFVTFAALLEVTGVQAYAGGLHLVESNDIKNAAASIATVEGRHSAFLNLLTGSGAAPGPFDTAMGLRPIVSIAAGLIRSCPFPLPAQPFPGLTTGGFGSSPQTAVSANSFIPLEIASTVNTEGLLCNWAFGVQQLRTPIVPATDSAGRVVPSCQVPIAIPQALFTQTMLFVVDQNRDVSLDDDKNVVAGPTTVHVFPPSRGIVGEQQILGGAEGGFLGGNIVLIKDAQTDANLKISSAWSNAAGVVSALLAAALVL